MSTGELPVIQYSAKGVSGFIAQLFLASTDGTCFFFFGTEMTNIIIKERLGLVNIATV